MALCAVVLSENGREKLWSVFVILSITLCIANICVISYSIYVSVFIAHYIPTEKAVIIFVYSVFAMSGMELITYYCLGLRVSKKSFVKAHKKNSNYLLRIWLFSGYSMVFNMVIIGTMIAGLSNHIFRSVHHSLERGMVLYLKDVVWKNAIDKLQYTMHCCGVHGHEDWHRILWFNSNIKNLTIKKYNDDTQIFLPIEPWSCCRLDYPICYHDAMQMSGSIDNTEKLKSINLIGCMKKIMDPLQNGFIFFILVSYSTLFLQILLTILSRFLYSSHRNAIILGNSYGKAPGWLWGNDNDLTKMVSQTSKSSIKNSYEDLSYSENKSFCVCSEINEERKRGGTDGSRFEKIKKKFKKIYSSHRPRKNEPCSTRTEYENIEHSCSLETNDEINDKYYKKRKQKLNTNNEYFTDTSSTTDGKNYNYKSTRYKTDSDESALSTRKAKKAKKKKTYRQQVREKSVMEKSKNLVKNAISHFIPKKDYEQINKTSDDSDKCETLSELQESLFLKNLS